MDLRTVWAAEVYTPTHAAGLLTAFERLGWERAEMPFRQTPGQWLRSMRDSPRNTGSYNLGLIRRPGGPQYLGVMVRIGPVPDFADTISLYLYQVSPAVAVIVAAFHLTADQGDVLAAELRRDRQSQALPIRRGYSIVRPTTLKREAVEAARARIRVAMRDWFSCNLPGLFSAAGAVPPSCEFLVFTGTPGSDRGGLNDLLGLTRSFDDFETSRWPGAALRFLRVDDSCPTLQGSLSIDADALAAIDLHGFGGNRHSFESYAERAMGAHLQQASALGLLEILERRLSRLRDVGVAHRRSRANRQLRGLEVLTQESLDLAVVARDLQALQNDWDEENLDWRSTRGSDETRVELNSSWARWIAERAQTLVDLDATLKAYLLQHANLLAARENLRLQGLVWLLAIVTGVLTLITAVEPAAKLYRLIAAKASSPIHAPVSDKGSAPG